MSRILNILLVEDDPINQKVASCIVKRELHNITIAENGSVGVEKYLSEKFDLILMDIQMPVMDGFEFLHYLRQDVKTSEIPVVMITSRTAEKHRKHAMELGATAYLGKPFNETELLTLLKSFA